MNTQNTSHHDEQMVNSLLEVLRELIIEVHPKQLLAQKVSLDCSLDRDLGLDSLSRVELLGRIEKKFNLSFPDKLIFEVESPRDLMRAIHAAWGRQKAPDTHPLSIIPAEKTGDTPDTANTLVDVLLWHKQRHPDRPHIRILGDEETPETLTYGQLWDGAKAIAGGLQQQGVQPGDAVVIMLPTGRDYFLSFFAVLLTGAIPVPIYPPTRRAQLEDHLRRHRGILSNCAASLMITVPEAKTLSRLLKSQVESLRHINTPDELASHDSEYLAVTLSPDDIAFLQYTSGSTGNPKGVILTHANLLTNIQVMGEAVQVDANDVFISWLPLYHDMGLIGAWFGSLYFSIPLVIMSPLTFLTHPHRWLWAIHEYRGSISASPNFGYELCVKRITDEDIQGLDLSSWRLSINGAEPVSPDTIQRFTERFAMAGYRTETMMPVYGLAESTVGLAFPPVNRTPIIDRIERLKFMDHGYAVPTTADDPNALRFVACGHPLRGHEIRIVDEAGRELPERQEGNLQFRGPSATSGYYRNPEADRSLFKDGWLNSGDLGYVAEGDIYITGRTKDMINRAGRNIYPHELEETIGGITSVRKGCVAVFGSKKSGADTEQLVVLAETRETDESTLIQIQSEIISVTAELIEAAPDEIILAPPHTVLKTSSGKIRRSACRELYERGQLLRREKALWQQVTHLAFASLLPMLRRGRRRFMDNLYAGYAWAIFGLLAPAAWLAIVLVPRYSWRWQVMRILARTLAWATFTRIEIRGLQHLTSTMQSCVLVSNHASYLDGYALVAVLPRPFHFVAKAELMQKFASRIIMKQIRAEIVDRTDKHKALLDTRRIAHTAHEQESILFFPEGTFTRIPGILPFRMGAFVTAEATNLPVIPIAIRGTRSMLRANTWFPRRGKITITIGEPINPYIIRQTVKDDAWSVALKLRDVSRENIIRFSGEPDLAHEKLPV